MMRQLLIVFLFSNLMLTAQINKFDYLIKKDTNEYYISNKLVTVYSYEVENVTEDYLWLWFDKRSYSTRNSTEDISNYFFSRKKKDASLFDIAMEVNIRFQPSIFSTFVKRIKPHEIFTVYWAFLSSDNKFNNLYKHESMKSIELYQESDLIRINNLFSLMCESKHLFYEGSYVVILPSS